MIRIFFRPEPYTLLDPFTGRNKDNVKTQKKPKSKKSFLFGLPFDLFQDKSSHHKPITRTQRRIPVSIETRNPYLSSNGTPIYKYRQKNPLGYGRKKRAAPWVLLDPTTGRTLEQPLEQQPLEDPIQSVDPLQQQFFNPGLRQERRPENVPNIYLANNGTPLYKYRNKYPHGYHG